MENRVLIALVLVAVLVVGVNGMLFLALRKGRTGQHIRLWQQAARRARNPWGKEDEQLSELSKLVSELEDKTDADD